MAHADPDEQDDPRTASLAGPNARLRWAEARVQDLNEMSRQYALTLGEVDPAETLLDASLLTSNIVHQLCSSLDNLVWQLVLLAGNTLTGRTPSRSGMSTTPRRVITSATAFKG
jgi:hypothetical protein